MSNVTEVVKILELDLTGIPSADREAAKKEVGDYLLNAILRDVNKGTSPVEGEGRFRSLQKDYATKEKGGVRTANLELDGDLLNALKAESLSGDKIEVGVRGKEAPKADGHNQISAEAKAWAKQTNRTKYKRRFIPDDNQKFKKSIMNEVTSILDSYRQVGEEQGPTEKYAFDLGLLDKVEVGKVANVQANPKQTTATVEDLFSDESIEALLAQALARR